MLSYALRRILGAIPTLFIIITLSFFMMRVAPGGPFDGERKLPPEIERNIKAAYNLDKPVYQQYFIYLERLTHGDFGPSYKNKDFTVGELIGLGAPVSARTMLGLDALRLMRDRSFATFIVCSFLICVPLSFYFSWMNAFMNELKIPNAAAKMTIGQVSDVVFLLLLPFLLRRLGVKGILILGMVAAKPVTVDDGNVIATSFPIFVGTMYSHTIFPSKPVMPAIISASSLMLRSSPVPMLIRPASE